MCHTKSLTIKKGNRSGFLFVQFKKTDYFAADAEASATVAAAEAAATWLAASATAEAGAAADAVSTTTVEALTVAADAVTAGAEASTVVVVVVDEATVVEAVVEASAGAASSFLLHAVIAKDAATKLDTAINLTFITCSPKENNPVFTRRYSK